MKTRIVLLFSALALYVLCANCVIVESPKPEDSPKETRAFPKKLGDIELPQGYVREKVAEGSFAAYLRSLPLKPQGSPVLNYRGEEEWTSDVAYAVVDKKIGNKDLHQCADAIIRLRAEWLYEQKRYNDIAFNFTNGFRCEYARWANGERVSINGNKTTWVKKGKQDYSYATFWNYLEMVFSYAGTLSLSKEMKPVAYKDMQIGDVFIRGGSPGHAIIVVDIATHRTSGKKMFMVAESYMPAQEIHVIRNLDSFFWDGEDSPWFSLSDLVKSNQINFVTYQYGENELKRF